MPFRTGAPWHWQEKWIAGVQAGIEAADRGEFASEEEIARVLNKFGRA